MKNDAIKAVHDDDLDALLSSLDLYEAVKLGEVKCHFCGDTITLETLAAVFPINGKIGISCNKQNCHLSLVTGGIDEC